MHGRRKTETFHVQNLCQSVLLGASTAMQTILPPACILNYSYGPLHVHASRALRHACRAGRPSKGVEGVERKKACTKPSANPVADPPWCKRPTRIIRRCPASTGTALQKSGPGHVRVSVGLSGLNRHHPRVCCFAGAEDWTGHGAVAESVGVCSLPKADACAACSLVPCHFFSACSCMTVAAAGIRRPLVVFGWGLIDILHLPGESVNPQRQ